MILFSGVVDYECDIHVWNWLNTIFSNWLSTIFSKHCGYWRPGALLNVSSYLWDITLAPRRCGCHFKSKISNLLHKILAWALAVKIALGWMPQQITIERSTLVQVMDCCLMVSSHYLIQCWPRSMGHHMNKIANILHKTSSNAFSWMKIIIFSFKPHRRLSSKNQIYSHSTLV